MLQLRLVLERELVGCAGVLDGLRQYRHGAFVVGPVNHVVYSLLLIPSP
jgi:hypothetical protein